MVSRVIPVDPFDLVIFGGTGDLSRRKIIPALFHRFHAGQMPSEARVIGAARGEMTSDEFRAFAGEALEEFAPGQDEVWVKEFLSRLDYVRGRSRTACWKAPPT